MIAAFLVRGRRHGEAACWQNLNGAHVSRALCLCATSEGWECPIDGHAIRWLAADPMHEFSAPAPPADAEEPDGGGGKGLGRRPVQRSLWGARRGRAGAALRNRNGRNRDRHEGKVHAMTKTKDGITQQSPGTEWSEKSRTILTDLGHMRRDLAQLENFQTLPAAQVRSLCRNMGNRLNTIEGMLGEHPETSGQTAGQVETIAAGADPVSGKHGKNGKRAAEANENAPPGGRKSA